MIRATSSKITLGLKSGHSWRATPGPLVLKSLTTPGGGDPLHLAHGTGLVVCCCCFVHIDRLRVPHETFRRRTQGQVRALPGRAIDGDEPRHGGHGRGRAGVGPEGVEGLGALRSPIPLPFLTYGVFISIWFGGTCTAYMRYISGRRRRRAHRGRIDTQILIVLVSAEGNAVFSNTRLRRAARLGRRRARVVVAERVHARAARREDEGALIGGEHR